MKFICENCKAKYQIGDDKVAGRSVRMKCRRCGHLIQLSASVVTEGAGAAADHAPSDVVDSSLVESGSASFSVSALLGGAKPPEDSLEDDPTRAMTLEQRKAAGSAPAATAPASAAAPTEPAGTSPAATVPAAGGGAARPGLGASPLAPRPLSGPGAAGRGPVGGPGIGAGAPRPGLGATAPGARPAAGATAPAASRPLGGATAGAGALAQPRPGAAGLGAAAQKSAATPAPSVAATAKSPALGAGAPPPAEDWYVGVAGAPLGPVGLGVIREKAQAGAIHPDSLVWREGFEEWRPLKNFPELLSIIEEAQAARAAKRPSAIPPRLGATLPTAKPLGITAPAPGARAPAPAPFQPKATAVGVGIPAAQVPGVTIGGKTPLAPATSASPASPLAAKTAISPPATTAARPLPAPSIPRAGSPGAIGGPAPSITPRTAPPVEATRPSAALLPPGEASLGALDLPAPGPPSRGALGTPAPAAASSGGLDFAATAISAGTPPPTPAPPPSDGDIFGLSALAAGPAPLPAPPTPSHAVAAAASLAASAPAAAATAPLPAPTPLPAPAAPAPVITTARSTSPPAPDTEALSDPFFNAPPASTSAPSAGAGRGSVAPAPPVSLGPTAAAHDPNEHAADLRAAGLAPRRGMHPLAYAFIAMAAAFGAVVAFLLFSRPPQPIVIYQPMPGAATAAPGPDIAGPSLPAPPSALEPVASADATSTAPRPQAGGSSGGGPKPTGTGAAAPLDTSGFGNQVVPGPNTTATATAPELAGSQLTQGEIQGVVAANQGRVRKRCWQPALDAAGAGASPNARVRGKIVIGPSGAVQSASASGAEKDYPGLSSCIAAQMQGWKFPASSSSTPVEVPFVFAGQ